ncbi:uncharacterized protein LOC134269531 [Saccostrea cucullata]|uniref:uncharacterized protein LOC134269531 n=1 Tax=Saccostrea cuccullata TaxID=36930 RepID=UPI002ED260BA
MQSPTEILTCTIIWQQRLNIITIIVLFFLRLAIFSISYEKTRTIIWQQRLNIITIIVLLFLLLAIFSISYEKTRTIIWQQRLNIITIIVLLFLLLAIFSISYEKTRTIIWQQRLNNITIIVLLFLLLAIFSISYEKTRTVWLLGWNFIILGCVEFLFPLAVFSFCLEKVMFSAFGGEAAVFQMHTAQYIPSTFAVSRVSPVLMTKTESDEAQVPPVYYCHRLDHHGSSCLLHPKTTRYPFPEEENREFFVNDSAPTKGIFSTKLKVVKCVFEVGVIWPVC